MRRLFRFLFPLAVLCLAACSEERKAAPGGVISLSPALTELICQLGCEDRLAARSTACDWPESVKSLPTAGDFAEPELERILAMKPALVVSNMFVNPKDADALRQAGIAVELHPCDSFADYRDWVVRMGGLLDCPDAAAAEVGRADSRIAEFEAELKNAQTKPLRALYVIWDSPLLTAGADTLPDAVGRLAGLENIVTTEKGYPSISLEFVLKEDPDVIVWFAHGKDWKSNPSWEGIRAVQTDHVLVPRDDSALLRPGPRMFDGVADLRADLETMFPSERKSGPGDRTVNSLWNILLYLAAVAAAAAAASVRGVKTAWIVLLYLAAVSVAAVCGVLCGAAHIPLSEFVHDGALDPIVKLRIVRTAAAAVVGASLAVSGLVFQAVLRNALAEPFLLGVSGGAGLGAAGAIILGFSAWGFMSVPLFALLGAVVANLLVFAAVRRRGAEELLLGGVMIGTLASSLLMVLITFSHSHDMAGVIWWMLGSVQNVDPVRQLAPASALLAAALVFLFVRAGDVDLLTFGPEYAWNHGVNARTMTVVLLALASLLAAVTVSMAGIIGFCGLVVPHIVRRLHGGSHRKILIPAALAGAVFLMLADILGRVVSPVRELPVGMVTAAVGCPVFLWILNRSRAGS